MSDGAAHAHSMGDWTLRFRDARAEKGFVDSRAERLAKNTFALSGLACLHATLMLGTIVNDWSTSGGKFVDAPETAPVALCRNLLALTMVAWLAVVMFMMRSRTILAMLGSVGMEWVAANTTTMLCVLSTVIHPWCLIKTFGLDESYLSDSTESPAAPTGLALTLDVIITASHCALPVRFQILCPAKIAALLCYGYMIFSWSPQAVDASINDLLMLLCLFAAACVGCREMQRLEREAFARIARERTLRCEAEHQLQWHATGSPALCSQQGVGARCQEGLDAGLGSHVDASSSAYLCSLPETLQTEAKPTPQFFTASCADISEALSCGASHLDFARNHCPKSRETVKTMMNMLVDPDVGGALVVIADHEAFKSIFEQGGADTGKLESGHTRASIRTCDEGYMNRRLRDVHISDKRFVETLRDFTAHTDNDRWPEDCPDEQARGRPKDGAFLLSSSGYRVNCCVKLLGLGSAGRWDNVGTKHETALACAWAVPRSFVFVKSSSGVLHLATRSHGALNVYHVVA
mmetsp:Transcript_151630/g.385535  ORF Transcript_151630/g.385535 Transcript_151630/m.385535 type:complete len:521 (-) Transcript_151630:103-1665(-)